jgi:hypothetical protein
MCPGKTPAYWGDNIPALNGRAFVPSPEVKNHAYPPDMIEHLRVRDHAEHGQVKLVGQQQMLYCIKKCRRQTLLNLRIRQIAVFFSHGYFNGKTHSGTHADCSTGSPHSP